MPRFKFRLEAALHLAERSLEEERRHLAVEIEALRQKKFAYELQENRYKRALEGQREAGIQEPQNLGSWQMYAQKQLERLRQLEEELIQQERRVEDQRLQVMKVHQELEKLKRLKAKQEAEFWLKEQRKEQQVLDEAGQVIFRRLQEQHENETREGTNP